MALRSAIAFFRLHLVDADLLCFAGLYKIGRYRCAFDKRFAENDILTVNNSKNFVKSMD